MNPFKEMLPNEEPPKEIKEKLDSNLQSVIMLIKIAELFTVDGIRSVFNQFSSNTDHNKR